MWNSTRGGPAYPGGSPSQSKKLQGPPRQVDTGRNPRPGFQLASSAQPASRERRLFLEPSRRSHSPRAAPGPSSFFFRFGALAGTWHQPVARPSRSRAGSPTRPRPRPAPSSDSAPWPRPRPANGSGPEPGWPRSASAAPRPRRPPGAVPSAHAPRRPRRRLAPEPAGCPRRAFVP